MTTAVKKDGLRLKSAAKDWGKLSKGRRAVAVARDVLKLLDIKKLTAGYGYLTLEGLRVGRDDDAKTVLQQAQSCEVCAKGALFVARTIGRQRAFLGDEDGSAVVASNLITDGTAEFDQVIGSAEHNNKSILACLLLLIAADFVAVLAAV